MTHRKTTTTISLLLLTALALSACGRRGDPVRPSVARVQAAQEAGEKAPKPTPTEDRRFFLDALLD